MRINAVTEYIDHHRPTSSDSFSKEEVRLGSIWFVSGANAKQKAWNAALEMITNLKDLLK